jgi:hypothetical protein
METTTRTTPADLFMEGLRAEPESVQRLIDRGIVIQSAEGDTVHVDYWQTPWETVDSELSFLREHFGTGVQFSMRNRNGKARSVPG